MLFIPSLKKKLWNSSALKFFPPRVLLYMCTTKAPRLTMLLRRWCTHWRPNMNSRVIILIIVKCAGFQWFSMWKTLHERHLLWKSQLSIFSSSYKYLSCCLKSGTPIQDAALSRKHSTPRPIQTSLTFPACISTSQPDASPPLPSQCLTRARGPTGSLYPPSCLTRSPLSFCSGHTGKNGK